MDRITQAANIHASASDIARWKPSRGARVRKTAQVQMHFLLSVPYIHPWCSTLKPQECFELDFPLNPHSLAVQLA